MWMMTGMKVLRFAPAALLALASCSPPAPQQPAVEVAVANPQPEPKPKTEPPAPKPEVAVQPKKEEPPAPPPEFPFPKDESGKLLPKVVAPPMPAMPPAEKIVTAPKPRPVPKVVRDPEALPKGVHAAPPLAIAKPATKPPTAPAERVPLDLGFGSAAVPERPKLPESPGIAVKARDVNLPPELAPLGRQVPDRASVDDPTSEPGNAVISNKSPTLSLGIAAFLKVVLPDPFELGEQVKPKVPAAAEPSPAPVVVNPQRMK
jgi:hypothetical protein